MRKINIKKMIKILQISACIVASIWNALSEISLNNE